MRRRVLAEVLSIDGTRFVRIDEMIPADDPERRRRWAEVVGDGGELWLMRR